jgi:hypothetical protein
MSITSGKNSPLPVMLLESLFKNFEIAFGVSVDYSLSDHKIEKQQQNKIFLEEPILEDNR